MFFSMPRVLILLNLTDLSIMTRHESFAASYPRDALTEYPTLQHEVGARSLFQCLRYIAAYSMTLLYAQDCSQLAI